MVRCYWKGALVLTLAWAGAAQGQQANPPQGRTAERILTVQEPGKPAEQCRVLSSRRLPDGKTALEVQSLATGAVSTIIEGPPAAAGTAQPAAPAPAGPDAQVIPAGARQPAAPATAVPGERLQPTPAGSPVPGTSTCGCATDVCCALGHDLRTLREPGRPPLHFRVSQRWRATNGYECCQGKCLENGEMLTVLETGPADAVEGAGPGTGFRAMSARIFHWGRYTTSPPGAPLPPEGAVVVVEDGSFGPLAAQRAGLGTRLKDRFLSLFTA